MKPIFYTLNSNLPIMIIPDSQAHFDGHGILTYTYSIYIDKQNNDPIQEISKETQLHLTKINDPDYLGYITFEQPGRVYNYTGNGKSRLSIFEIQETVEFLNALRNTPLQWDITDLEKPNDSYDLK
ncbi:hypothetical protein SNE25_25430 [Mucilaginibacter sabulilitoris]|uniref:DUF695 domain-containing protein n=1 Tax=Mucilaginibacter sabulilitoris TaxID=1173583 RepID=A0ABZ0THL0_9SPHI|nr:hypothetical protein [Mucilaginibacter sabulilitoris]WPU92669.1 hypothetical protein SNE25_25430 [Mucilaginibacter sabulilitoris]